MKLKIIIISLLLGATFQTFLSAHTLSWKIDNGERIEIVRTAAVKVYLNSMVVKQYRERNIVDFTCYGKTAEGANVKGLFSIFHADSAEDLFRLESRFFSDFIISPEGRFSVSEKYIMPNVRHIPTFPKRNLSVSDTWVADSELILDHLSTPLDLVIPVSYKFESIEKRTGRDCALISYSYILDRNLSGMNYPSDFPRMVAAKDKGVIIWDIAAGRPIDSSEDYRIIFLQPDGINTVEFKMTINSTNKVYAVVPQEESDKNKKDLEKELGGKNGISVDSDPRGLIVRMGEILFDIDSASLRTDTRSTLDAVIDAIKKKYPDREITVEGHTDSTGEKTYNQALSDKRAEAVARYMGKGVGHDKISFRGFGASKPIADNASKEGREKNRRVEIIIKLN